MPPAHMAIRMTRGLTLGSSGIHGSFAPQDGHVVASRATGLVQSRQGTVSGTVLVIQQLHFGLSSRDLVQRMRALDSTPSMLFSSSLD